MVNATEIERVLRTKLAPTLQTGIPRLALVLMDIINGTEAPQSLERTLTLDPNLVPLFQALAGQTIALGGVSLMVGAAPELERTVGMPAQSSPQLQVVHTEGHEQIGDD